LLPISAIFIGRIYDQIDLAVQNGTIATLDVRENVYFVAGIGVVGAIVELVGSMSWAIYAQWTTYHIRSKFFAKVLTQEMGFLDQNKTGKLLSYLNDVCAMLGDSITRLFSSVRIFLFLHHLLILIQSLASFANVVAVLIVCFSYSWKLTLIILAYEPLFLVILIFTQRYILNLSLKIAPKHGEV